MHHRAYKTEIYPNNVQKTLLKKHIGAARWAFNWGLDIKKKQFEAKEKISTAYDLSKKLTTVKGTEELPWAYDVSKWVFQTAFADVDEGFSHFWRRCKTKCKQKGFPKFKSKRGKKQSFKVYDVIVHNDTIKLPRIGKIKLAQTDYLPVGSLKLSATVSSKAGRWFVSVLVEEKIEQLKDFKNEVVGVDLGIKTLATCSDGTTFQNPKALSSNLRKLKRIQRRFSKKKKGSNNRKKQQLKLSKIHYRIANIRKDALHKATSKIVNENQVIVLEDLVVGNMIKNRKLSRAISDVGLYEFRRQIEYKSKWKGRTVILADRFFPSSKMDHKSKKINHDLKLSDRIIYHDNSTMTDRDLNAALNLKEYGVLQMKLKNTEGSSEINALGDGSSSIRQELVSLSLKKEINRRSVK